MDDRGNPVAAQSNNTDDRSADSLNGAAPLSDSEKRDLARINASAGLSDFNFDAASFKQMLHAASQADVLNTSPLLEGPQPALVDPAFVANLPPETLTGEAQPVPSDWVVAQQLTSKDAPINVHGDVEMQGDPSNGRSHENDPKAGMNTAETRAATWARFEADAKAEFPTDYSTPRPLSWWNSPSPVADANSALNGWLGSIADNTSSPLNLLLAKGGQALTDTFVPATNGGAVIGIASLIDPALRVGGSLFEGSAVGYVERSAAAERYAEASFGNTVGDAASAESDIVRGIARNQVGANGSTTFADLSSGAKRLVTQFDPALDLEPGSFNLDLQRAKIGNGVQLDDLRAASEFNGREMAVVQDANGNLVAVQGDVNGIRNGHLLPGDDFLIHTHPVYESEPGHFTLDIRNASEATEAVVDWGGNVTYFNKYGIIEAPTTAQVGEVMNPFGYIGGH